MTSTINPSNFYHLEASKKNVCQTVMQAQTKRFKTPSEIDLTVAIHSIKNAHSFPGLKC